MRKMRMVSGTEENEKTCRPNIVRKITENVVVGMSVLFVLLFQFGSEYKIIDYLSANLLLCKFPFSG